MHGSDYGWIETQLDTVGYTETAPENRRVRKAVIELFHTLDAQSPKSQSERTTIIELFNSLATGREISPGSSENSGAQWVDFVPGLHPVGSQVRVRHNAYEGLGARQNGLTGSIVAIRGGRVLIQYSGRNDGLGHAHNPDAVEVLVK